MIALVVALLVSAFAVGSIGAVVAVICVITSIHSS